MTILRFTPWGAHPVRIIEPMTAQLEAVLYTTDAEFPVFVRLYDLTRQCVVPQSIAASTRTGPKPPQWWWRFVSWVWHPPGWPSVLSGRFSLDAGDYRAEFGGSLGGTYKCLDVTLLERLAPVADGGVVCQVRPPQA